MDYNEKLRDPRWQKRRLEIMERDNFTCRVCGRGINDGTPLNVHHKKYKKDKEIWEYSNNLLITLCEGCHKKVHDGEIILEEKKPVGKYQSVIYYPLFKYRDKLSGSDAIAYSNLLKMSIHAKDFQREGDYIKLVSFTVNNLAMRCRCSSRNIRYSLKQLKELGFIKNDTIYCPEEMTERYVKLQPVGLRGWQLVFYSLIKDKADYFGGSIDTWACRLAEEFGTTTNNIYMYINILKTKGYVYRTENGRLATK